jgi:glutamate racemase
MSQHDARPIGVFDSGIGGLTVLKALRERFPAETFIYVADIANLPYGEKTFTQIQALAKQILDWFAEQNVKMVIMACNTSSALALDAVKDAYAFPILGLIEPIAQSIAKEHQRIGVMATAATVNSRAYEIAFKRVNPNVEVFSVACPRLVPLIEAHQEQTPYAQQCVEEYLQPLLAASIDTLVYGCTHYPYLDGVIRSILPANITIADPANYVTQAAQQYLGETSETVEHKPPLHFYATADEPRLQMAAEKIWGENFHVSWLNFDRIVAARGQA